MTAKKWVICFIAGFLAVVMFIGGMNYFVDPYGYFTFMDGEYEVYQESENTYARYIKAKQIQYQGNDYDAYIIGGSKAGALKTEKMSELDGYNYYNAWLLSGNVREYLLYTQFILENTDCKKIVLHLSGPEVRSYDRQSYGDLYKTPACVTGENEFSEVVAWLGKNISASWEKLWKQIKGEYKITNPSFETGERNLGNRYTKMTNDPEGYANESVMHDYDSFISDLFNKPAKCAAINQNLAAYKTIKNLCDSKGVELQVIIGANFVSELHEYECEAYYEYLSDIVEIFGDVWDFSGFNSVSMNKYNFYNESHYKYEVGNLMVDTIAKGSQIVDGFGVHVNLDNRYEWLTDKRDDFEKYKQEFLKTGTIDISAYTFEDRIQ